MKEFLEKAQRTISENGDSPLFKFTLNELEPVFKAWIQQVLQSSHPDSTEQKLITRAEACEMLKCSYPTLLSFEKRGRLTSLRIGHKVFYNHDEILKNLKD